jgi:hypothetical protein
MEESEIHADKAEKAEKHHSEPVVEVEDANGNQDHPVNEPNLAIPDEQQNLLLTFKRKLTSAIKSRGKSSMKRELAGLEIG